MGERTILKYTDLFLKILPIIVNLIQFVERIAADLEGQEKKDIVMIMLHQLTDTLSDDSFGEYLSDLIDIVVPFIKSNK